MNKNIKQKKPKKNSMLNLVEKTNRWKQRENTVFNIGEKMEKA